jgi:predicted ABC-type transport system involved in lysophospholipase L1 biosynthesis ATPase subunit
MEAMREDAALLRLSGIHKHYRNGLSSVHALCDINLQVEPGEMVAVCGPSGHGKTTLLNLINMLEPASEGSLVLDGVGVCGLDDKQRAALRGRAIGAVFQCFKLIPVMTAQENVMLPLLLRRRLKRAELSDARAFASELLARVGLATQVHHFPARLDAGQCQRVAIARALMTRPRLVVADEPTSRLDASSLRMVLELFAAWQREHGTAFVISTGDQRQLGRASRTLQLNDGRLAARPADQPRHVFRVPA